MFWRTNRGHSEGSSRSSHEVSRGNSSLSNNLIGTTTTTRKRVRFSDLDEFDDGSEASGSRGSNDSGRYLPSNGILRNTSCQTEGKNGAVTYGSGSQSRSVTQFAGALSTLRSAGRRVQDSSAVQNIVAYLRECDLKPKTGYTYAFGLGYDIDGAPNPPMPNMSRYSLDHYSRHTQSGYDYSLSHRTGYSESSSKELNSSTVTSRSNSALETSRGNSDNFLRTRRLSFGDHEESQPEVSSPFRDYLAKLYRKTVKVITTTTTTSEDQAREQREKDLLERLTEEAASRTVTSNGRVSPESRSGTEYGEMRSLSSMSSAVSRTDNHDQTDEDRLLRSSRQSSAKPAYSNGHVNTGYSRTASSAENFAGTTTQTRSFVDVITRRFIDVVTKTTTTITDTLNLTSSDSSQTQSQLNRNRSRWAVCCCCLPLLLLCLIPFLLGLWTLLGAASQARSPSSVIYNFYHGLSRNIFGFTDRGTTLPPVYYLNSTNFTREDLDRIITFRLGELEVPRNCCDDLVLLREQVDLILQKLTVLEGGKPQEDQWRRDREKQEGDLRISVDELRLILVRLEEASKVREEYVPKVVQERERFTFEDVRLLIAGMIKRYDEDKIGEPDHALESAGGTVISTRCTEDYKWGHAQFSIFGIPLWSWTTSPRLAIQDDLRPGQCWAFKGDQGYLVLKLAGLVRPTSFTIEHLSKNLSPTGKIDSAPRGFEVYGLVSEQGPGYLLGRYEYLDNDQSLQNFQIQTKLESPVPEAFGFIELRITSNHGHPEYTCLYRFRVHGIMVKRGENW